MSGNWRSCQVTGGRVGQVGGLVRQLGSHVSQLGVMSGNVCVRWQFGMIFKVILFDNISTA